MPHTEAGHQFAHAYSIVSVCGVCGHGQLEQYSHDCFSFYEDDDWNMYWWYALAPAEVSRWRARVDRCPDRLNAQCDCALHRDLRASGEHLAGGVAHAVSPEEHIRFAWIVLDDRDNPVTLNIDTERGMGRSASVSPRFSVRAQRELLVKVVRGKWCALRDSNSRPSDS